MDEPLTLYGTSNPASGDFWEDNEVVDDDDINVDLLAEALFEGDNMTAGEEGIFGLGG